MKMYRDISGIITRFLVKYNLADIYLDNLPPNQQCIGCTRDGGDHDAECPLKIKESDYITVHSTHSSETYKKQIEQIDE